MSLPSRASEPGGELLPGGRRLYSASMRRLNQLKSKWEGVAYLPLEAWAEQSGAENPTQWMVFASKLGMA